MNKVYACIYSQSGTSAVIDGAVWAAQRLAIPLEFLHVLERPAGHADAGDFSVPIGLASQEPPLAGNDGAG